MCALNSCAQHPHPVSAFVCTAVPGVCVSVPPSGSLKARAFLRQSRSPEGGGQSGVSHSSCVLTASSGNHLPARAHSPFLQRCDRIPPICLSQGAGTQLSRPGPSVPSETVPRLYTPSLLCRQSVRLRAALEESPPSPGQRHCPGSREEGLGLPVLPSSTEVSFQGGFPLLSSVKELAKAIHQSGLKSTYSHHPISAPGSGVREPGDTALG